MDSQLQSLFQQFQLPQGEDTSYAESKYSISTVPEELRKRNGNAYLPKMITIGPLCIGTTAGTEQKQMADAKLSCVKHLCEKSCSNDPQNKLKECMEAILGLDGVVRQSYAEEIKLDRDALAGVILTDGCFLLSLLLFYDEAGFNGGNGDYDSEVQLSDLVLLANQIPLFILRKLSEILSVEEPLSYGRIEYRARRLLGYPPPVSFNSTTDDAPAAHMLEVAYSSIPDPIDRVGQEQMRSSEHDVASTREINIDDGTELKGVELKRCASRLEATGVKIKRREAAEHKGIFNFGIRFRLNDGTLEIPTLRITKTTERRWLNFIAWEHHINKMKGKVGRGGTSGGSTSRCKCSWAALFFKALICSPSDVQLLKDRKVIVVDPPLDMSNLRLMRYFHSITEDVDDGIVVGSRYNKILYALNKYHRSPIYYATKIPITLWHYWTGLPQLIIRDIHAFLRRGYNYAVAVITVLSVLQTIYSVLSYHHPKK